MHSFLLDKPPRVAIDCRFLTLHSHRGMNLAAIQLKYLISENITRKTPWPLFLVNFDETNADLEKTRKKYELLPKNFVKFLGEIVTFFF